jgi:hypothetical protein
MREDFDYLQAQLIYKSERAHFYGLRSTSVTGPYNEDLLMGALTHALKKALPNVDFGRGNVVDDRDVDICGWVERASKHNGKRQPQVDVIVYKKGKGHFKDERYCVVKMSDVIACLEVKKWLQRKAFNHFKEGGKGNISWNEQYGSLPRLVVGFRIWESKKYKFEEIRPEKNFFVFSKRDKGESWTGCKGRLIEQLRNYKDDEEKIETIKERILIKGELRRLIERIADLSKM